MPEGGPRSEAETVKVTTRKQERRTKDDGRKRGRSGRESEQRDSSRISMAKWLSYLNGGGAEHLAESGTLTLPKRKLTPPP